MDELDKYDYDMKTRVIDELFNEEFIGNDEFGKNKSAKYGITSTCKSCLGFVDSIFILVKLEKV